MLNPPVSSLPQNDFSGGQVTNSSELSLAINQSPDCLNVHTDISKRLKKRLGFDNMNTSALTLGAANGVYHYVRGVSEQYLVALFGSTLKKMDVVNSAWDGTWDTVTVHASGTALTSNIMYNTSFNGDCIITTEGRDVPQKYDPNDNSGQYTNLHFGGSGTAPSGKYCYAWHNRVWIANTAANPDRLTRSDDSSHTAWTASAYDEIYTPDDVGLTGMISLRGRLYVFKKLSIHRVTYTGGTPLLDIKEVKSGMGTNSPRSLIRVSIPGKGEVIMYIGSDKQIYVFDGYESIPISEPIFEDNGISSVYANAINAIQLNRIHAVDHARRRHAVFFIPITSGEVDANTKLLIHCDGDNGGVAFNDDIGVHTITNSELHDSYTKLMLHMNGTDGSTTFTDEIGKTVTANGNAQIDTAQSVFGGAAGLLDGTGDYLSLADHADWDFGTGDLTIETRLRFNSTSGAQYLAYQTGAWQFFWNGAALSFNTGFSGSVTFAWTPSINTWYHLALIRTSGTVRCFVDGVQVGSDQTKTDNITGGTTLFIGDDGLGSGPVNGWLDELRISKGIARWTTTFTPSTFAYGKVVTDTAQSVFGGSSALFDGRATYLSIADNADWDFGTGDFTIDFRARFASLPSTNYYGLISVGGYTLGVELLYYKGVTEFMKIFVVNTEYTYNVTLTANTWYHFALVRNSNTMTLYLNGASIGSSDITGKDITGTTTGVYAGTDKDHADYFLNGWLDELRISKGIARWTANFTIPTLAYGGNTHAIVYNYLMNSFYPYDNMRFAASCTADNGAGERKVYTQDINYSYEFDTTNSDNGTNINAYWTSGKIDGGSEIQLKKNRRFVLTTSSAATTPTFQYRADWDADYSTAETLTTATRVHNIDVPTISDLLQWKFIDDSSSAAFELVRVSLISELIGMGK